MESYRQVRIYDQDLSIDRIIMKKGLLVGLPKATESVNSCLKSCLPYYKAYMTMYT